MVKKYSFVGILFLLFACLNLNAQQNKKPNILFIFADDLMFNSIVALENCSVKTPHLDKLMNNDVSFSRTYYQGSFAPAVCVATRTMLVTGAYLWKAASYSKKVNIGKQINENTPSTSSKNTLLFKNQNQHQPDAIEADAN